MKVRTDKAMQGCNVADVIIKAAAGEFASKGFAGARVDEIAVKAGVNKATIYYHIGGKEVLYKLVLKEVVGQIADQLEKITSAPDAPVEEKFRALIATISENILASEYFSPIIMREIAGGGENMPPEILALMGRVVSSLRRILSEGKDEGSLRDVDPILTHLLVVGGLNFLSAGMPLFKKLKANGHMDSEVSMEKSRNEIGRSLADLILSGIKSEK